MPSAAHEITTDLTIDELEARMAALDAVGNDYGPEIAQASTADLHVAHHYGIDMGAVRAAADEVEADVPVSEYRMFDPLPNAADEYIRFAQSPHLRVKLGVDEFDDVMRGIAPGELLLVVGFAHSGKTVLTTEVILNNRDKRIVFFTPDETRVLVLVKLCSLVHGISAEELEARIAADDTAAIEMVRATARDHFPNLAVCDMGVDLRAMDRYMVEAEHYWGDKAQLVIFDYAELLDGYDDARAAITALKAWGKNHNVPFMLLHQSSRTSGADGRSVTISSGGYGGEQQATFLIGVRRKKNEIIARILELKERLNGNPKDPDAIQNKIAELEYELRQHQSTVTFNLVKNKRPPSRLVDEIDFKLDPETGRVTKLAHGELVDSLANRADRRAEAIARARGAQLTVDGAEEPF